jgi:sigma-B regulation protein RsbU (phosphoserine phosphatase)
VCGKDVLTRVAVADVMGHGRAVSEVSEYLYKALEAHMNDGAGDEVLAEINHMVAQRGLEAMTTAAIIAFYTEDQQLYFAYAGHHPALVRRKADGR